MNPQLGPEERGGEVLLNTSPAFRGRAGRAGEGGRETKGGGALEAADHSAALVWLGPAGCVRFYCFSAGVIPKFLGAAAAQPPALNPSAPARLVDTASQRAHGRCLGRAPLATRRVVVVDGDNGEG